MVSRKRAKRECGTGRGRGTSEQNHAAPATVSGERLPYATEHGLQRRLGKAVKRNDPRARKPAIDRFACRAGCLG
jgi:hypothetical protein